MKEANNLEKNKINIFLGGNPEEFSEFCFKSPAKEKNIDMNESMPITNLRTPIMSPMPPKFSLDQCAIDQKSEIKNIKEEIKLTPK